MPRILLVKAQSGPFFAALGSTRLDDGTPALGEAGTVKLGRQSPEEEQAHWDKVLGDRLGVELCCSSAAQDDRL
jgi:hypothetical protein